MIMLKLEKKNHYCIILQYYIFNYREEAAAGIRIFGPHCRQNQSNRVF